MIMLVRLLGLVHGQGESSIYHICELILHNYCIFSSGLSIEFMGVTNTAIAITEVGEADNAVLCRTDLTTCCGDGEGETRQGHWRYPNGILVANRGSGDDIYRDRETMVVRLNRRNSATTPTGQYCCEVATEANPSSIICITLSKL